MEAVSTARSCKCVPDSFCPNRNILLDRLEYQIGVGQGAPSTILFNLYMNDLLDESSDIH